MKTALTFRSLSVWGGLISLSMIGCAYLLEFIFKLEPCPLCLLQRYLLFGICFLFWFSAMQNCQKSLAKLFYGSLNLFFNLIGILLASRQIWLQYAPPDDSTTCTAGLDRLLQFQPLFTVLKEVILNSAECGIIDFTILQLPLSVWSLFGFIAFFIYSGVILWYITKRRI